MCRRPSGSRLPAWPGRGPGGRGQDAPPPVERGEVAGWFAGRLPERLVHRTGRAGHRPGRDHPGGRLREDTRELVERLVLDSLVDAGVARSRSEALVGAVRLVGRDAEEWLEVRARGPQNG
jgi:hypothetical protein